MVKRFAGKDFETLNEISTIKCRKIAYSDYAV